MNKIVFDSDGLIKLIRSGIFTKLNQKCIISEQVYEETVIEGKKRLYEDAFEIEHLVKEENIIVKKVNKLLEMEGLGKGELSAYALFNKIKADAIVSDDKRFLRLLDEEKIPFIIPTEIIVALVETKKLKNKEGLEAIIKIKELVSKESYESAINALGGKT